MLQVSQLSVVPSHEQVPLPHLSNSAYLSNPPRSVWHSTQPPSPVRPAPPTPRKMSATRDAHTRRRSVVSAIPRPASGTSRRATPTSNSTFMTEADVPTDSTNVASTFANGPTSWKPSYDKPLPRLPRSDSLLPFTQRFKEDLSGHKQQLHLRHYSTQHLSSPSKVACPRPGLPKSQTAADISLAGRDVTPYRTLLKPMSPPLPKSHSNTSISCFAPPGQTPSPLKSTVDAPRVVKHKPSQVDVVDALRESRMTVDEFKVLNEVQKEAVSNHEKLKTRFQVKHYKPKSTSSGSSAVSSSLRRKSGSDTLNLTTAVSVNTDNVHVQDRRRHHRRPLLIDSALANTASTECDFPSPAAISGTTDWTGPDEEGEVNLSLVYFEEPPAYWTGRYMTICDRLRTQAMCQDRVPSPASCHTSHSASATVMDQSEVSRMEAALQELYRCCRTSQALKSFEMFETQLRANTCAQSKPPLTSFRSSDSGFFLEDDIRHEQAKERFRKTSQEPPHTLKYQPEENLATVKSSVARTEQPPMPNILSRLALPKSKTTSNLVGMQSGTQHGPTPSTHRLQKSQAPSVAIQKHARRTSYLPVSSKKQTTHSNVHDFSVKDHSTVADRTVTARLFSQDSSSLPAGDPRRQGQRRSAIYDNAVAHRQASKSGSDLEVPLAPPRLSVMRLPSSGSTVSLVESDDGLRRRVLMGTAGESQHRTIDGVDGVTDKTPSENVEAGHSVPPYPSSGSATNLEMVSGEKAVKSKRRSGRQSSGEFVKTLFDASISQVRKMGKRVGGSMSLGNSSGDLSAALGRK